MHVRLGGRLSPTRLATWCLATVGIGAALVAAGFDRDDARSSAAQVWSPFVLVAGLLLVGLVADDDGLFAALGYRLATLAPSDAALFGGAALIIAVVTALLNLDTSVVFLTPVLVHAARSRGQRETPLLIGCLLLSNAGSLLLPGSNLTNLIVLGHLHLSGGQFLSRMALPWVASVLLTGSLIALVERRTARRGSAVGTVAGHSERATPDGMSGKLGMAAVVALPCSSSSSANRRCRCWPWEWWSSSSAWSPVATGSPTCSRSSGSRCWSGCSASPLRSGRSEEPGPVRPPCSPTSTPVGSAVVAAGASVVVNNLPAASLLAARIPPHPFALLVGLNIGPNLFVTGSLAWILWWRTARAAGARPPVARAVMLGLVTVPLSMAVALAMLAVTGPL